MPLKLINAGGSVTLSVAVLAALWAVRSIRAASRQRRAAAASLKSLDGTTCTPKYLCTISPASVALLVHLQAVPYCILDVRTADQAAANPLPGWLASAVHVPVHLLSSALSPPHSAWFTSTSSSSSSGDNASAAATARPDPPTHHHLLVILAFDDDQGSRAAGWAAAAGYDRVATIAGGVKQFLQYSSPTATDSAADTAAYLGQPAAAAAGVAAGAQLPGLHRDALALLLDLVPLPESAYELCSSILGLNIQQQQQQQQQNNVAAANSNAQTGTPGKSSRLLVIDVRRHDERTLYGAIPGVMHIPADELAAALQLPAATFRRRYHDDPPVKSCDVVVTTSRGNKRARWAAQIAADAGLDNVCVHLDGTYGWRFSPAVEVYDSYQQWESPPDPENFTVCQPDVAAGAAELQQLGLLHLLLQQRSMR